MTEITKKDIKVFVIKKVMASLFWCIYLVLVFWMPLGGISGISFFKNLFSGTVHFNSIATFIHPLILIVYSCVILYNLVGIFKVAFSKDRFTPKENELESVYMSISSRPSTSAVVVLFGNIAFLFASLNQKDLSFNVGVIYGMIGVAISFLELVKKGKKKSLVEKRAAEMIDQEIKNLKANAEKNNQTETELHENKIDNLNLIAEYKKMCDSGIITAEDFEEKKQLLLKKK